jgi:flagellar biosynthesis chaperone FliJ
MPEERPDIPDVEVEPIQIPGKSFGSLSGKGTAAGGNVQSVTGYVGPSKMFGTRQPNLRDRFGIRKDALPLTGQPYGSDHPMWDTWRFSSMLALGLNPEDPAQMARANSVTSLLVRFSEEVPSVSQAIDEDLGRALRAVTPSRSSTGTTGLWGNAVHRTRRHCSGRHGRWSVTLSTSCGRRRRYVPRQLPVTPASTRSTTTRRSSTRTETSWCKGQAPSALRDTTDLQLRLYGSSPTKGLYAVEELDKLGGRERTLEHSLSEDGRRLITRVHYKDGDTSQIDVVLDPGTVIDTPEDMLFHSILAIEGIAHTVRGQIDSEAGFLDEKWRKDHAGIRGRQTIAGLHREIATFPLRALDFVPVIGELGDLGLNLEGDKGFDWRPLYFQRKEANERVADQVVESARAGFDRDSLIFLAAENLYMQTNDLQGSVQESMRDAAQYSDEDIQAIAYEAFTEESLRPVIDEAQDDRTLIRQVTDSAVMATVGTLEWWDGLVHKIGGGILGAFEIGLDAVMPEDWEPNWWSENGFRNPQQMGEAWADMHRVTDLFNISEDDPLAPWIDLSASIAFDPFLWMTPGGKGLLQESTRMLSTKAGAAELARGPIMRSRIVMAVTGARKGNAALIHRALPGSEFSRVRTLLRNNFTEFEEFARQGGGDTYQLVERMIENAMPANDGLAWFDLTGRNLTRNTAFAAARLGKANFRGKTGRMVDKLRHMLTAYPQERALSLSMADDFEEVVVGFYSARMAAEKGLDAATLNDEMIEMFNLVDEAYEVARGNVPSRSAADDALRRVEEEMTRFRGRYEPDVRNFQSTMAKKIDKLEDELVTATPERRAAILGGHTREEELARELNRLRSQRSYYRRQLREATDSLSPERIQVWERQVEVLEEAIQKVKSDVDDLGEVLPKGIRRGDPEYMRLSQASSEYREGIRILKARKQTAIHAGRAAGTVGDREAVRSLMDTFYHNMGETIRDMAARAGKNPEDILPYAKGKAKGKYINGKPLHDWKVVTGKNWDRTLRDEGVSFKENVSAITEGLDEETVAVLDYSHYARTRSHYNAPASIYEIAGYMGMMDQAKWAEKILGDPSWFRSKMMTWHRLWATNILLGPRTVIRSATDELFSVASSRGRVLGDKAAPIHIDVYGNLVPGPVPGPLASAPIEFGPSNTLPVNQRAGRAAIESDVGAPWTRLNTTDYADLAPGAPGYATAVGRQIEGLAVYDPVTRAAAGALAAGDDRLFIDWWRRVGWRYGHQTKLDEAGITIADGATILESRRTLFQHIADGFPADMRDDIYRRLIDSASGGPQLPYAKLRKYGTTVERRVIGMAPEKTNSVMERAFDLLYSTPGQNRFGLVHQMHYSDVLHTLWKAKTENETLLTPAKLVEVTDGILSEVEAEAWLRVAPWEVQEQLRSMNLYLPRQLEEMADRIARRYARAQMYTPGANTILGKKFQLVFPFGPAQVDYIGRYSLLLTEAAHVGLNPTVRKAAEKVPGLKKLLQGTRHATPLSVGGRPIPVNLRLLGRIGEFGGALATQQAPSLREDLERDPIEEGTPASLFDELTFFPVDMRPSRVIMSLFPQGGPLPVVVWNTLPPALEELGFVDMDEARGWVETIFPGLGFEQTPIIDSSGPNLEGLVDVVLSNSPGSLRGALDAFASRYASSLPAGWGTANIIRWFNDAGILSTPLNFPRVYRANIGDYIRENGIPLTAELGEIIDTATLDAWNQTSNADLMRVIKKHTFQFWNDPYPYSGEMLEFWEPLTSTTTLDLLREAAEVGLDEANLLQERWEATKGSIDPDVWREFGDQAHAIWSSLSDDMQDWLIVQNPEMAVNAVPGYQVRMKAGQPVKPEYARGDGSLQLPLGDEGREIFARGMQEGWIIHKNETMWTEDVLGRIAGAYSNIQAMLWQGAYGVQWGGLTNELDLANPRKPLVLTEDQLERWEQAGVNGLREGQFAENGVYTIPHRYAALMFDNAHKSLPGIDLLIEEDDAEEMVRQTANQRIVNSSAEATEAIVRMRRIEDYEKEYRDLDRGDWPLDARNEIREHVQWFVDYGYLDEATYGQNWGRRYGSLDYEPPTFPAWDDLPDDWRIVENPSYLRVIDGDTLEVETDNGPVIVRLVGVNAQDYTGRNTAADEAYNTQRLRLQLLVDQAESVAFGIPDPQRFTIIREQQVGSSRFNLVMYINGVPIVDPTVFSPQRPEGGFGFRGNGVPLELVHSLIGEGVS